jgi:hypothetical protein
MVAIRERMSDVLLRVGTERSMERLELERSLAGTPSDAPGRDCAFQAVLLASCVDSVVLWLGWRLRPATAFPSR